MMDLLKSATFESGELELVPEALKDLTVAMQQAKHVRAGETTGADICECGTC